MIPPMLWLVILLLAVGVLASAAAVGLTAWSLLHPPRMTDGKAMWVLRRLSPQDLGLDFEDLEFNIRDESGRPLKIAAWWVPNPSSNGRCAVLVHGYADAKVGAIAWALPWYALGFNLLVPDLRAHGESEGSASTAGYFEREDLRQVLDEFRAARPQETKQLVLFGASMGAAVAAATAQGREDVNAVVMDSPYADFRTAAVEYIAGLGVPKWLGRMAVRLAGWLSGADFDVVSVEKMTQELRCPVLIIESGTDLLLRDHGRRLQVAVDARPSEYGKAEIWRVDGAAHLMAVALDAKRYQKRLKEFVDAVLAGTQIAATARIPSHP
jgi:pimeloyl-ACP methyl ester carboxylesterase